MIPTVEACPVCGGSCNLFDVVDFNRSADQVRDRPAALSGRPVYYSLCSQCGFCFAPELHRWPRSEFAHKIYNSDYVHVDPDYVETRPRTNAANLRAAFGAAAGVIRHLDYGGGDGLLAAILREAGWNSFSYDPFVDDDSDPAELGRFDLITAYEVFEHVPDVRQLMAHLRLLLAPDGLVLFSTLVSDGSIHPDRRLTWWYAAPRNGHISLYSRNSLAVLAHAHAFKFGSFSPGLHAFFTEVPPWASHLMRAA